jgi:hypothetical protein
MLPFGSTLREPVILLCNAQDTVPIAGTIKKAARPSASSLGAIPPVVWVFECVIHASRHTCPPIGRVLPQCCMLSEVVREYLQGHDAERHATKGSMAIRTSLCKGSWTALRPAAAPPSACCRQTTQPETSFAWFNACR